jgi:LmbE family N-acetylglucosaminyl deacetylase
MIGLNPAQPPQTILCIGAHSDDIEIGCGATLLQLIKRYPHARFVWMVLSGDDARAREATASARAYLRGVDHQLILERFRDGFFPYQGEAIKTRFEALKTEVQPDLIFTHRHDDAHQDHRTLAQFTWNTFRNHLIFEYEIPKWDGDLQTPNVYVPLEAALVKRKTALLIKHFGTQRNKHWFSADTFTSLLRIRGLECASPSGFAEGFFGRKLALTWP